MSPWYLAAGVAVLMVAASSARAQDEHCAAERAEAEQVPQSAEDVRAYHDCVEKWRAAAAAETAAREAARQKAEEDAHEAVERARDEREKPIRDARGLVVLGSLLLGGGGTAATIAGGMGITALAAPPPSKTGGPVGDGNGLMLAMAWSFGIVGGGVMIPGLVVLCLGARDHARAKRAMALDRRASAQ